MNILLFLLYFFMFYANSARPDQTPQNAASYLGLQCLPGSSLWDKRTMGKKLISMERHYCLPSIELIILDAFLLYAMVKVLYGVVNLI